jgi:hypothetical protein
MALFALVVAALASNAFAPSQDPWIDVQTPSHVFELEEGYAISVVGEGFLDTTPTVRVFDGHDEITSQLTVTLANESRIDSDSDGVLEEYFGEFNVALGQYDPDPGHILRVEVSASAPGGTVRNEGATDVRRHVEVVVDSEIDFGDDSVHVSVTSKEMFVDSHTLRVFLGSTEVTSAVAITGPVTVYEGTDPGTPPFVRHRDHYYTVDVSGLGEFSERLHFVVTASGSGRGGTATGTSTGTGSTGGSYPVTPEEPGPCEQALDDFMDALGLSGGGTTGEPVTVGASAQEVKDAADALQDALEENDCPLRGQHTGPGGQTMKYKVGKDSTSSTKNADASSNKHDLVVAVGGDAASGSGGNATAKNDKAGGAAVAAGGNGSSGSTNPGTGGTAKATATPPTGAGPAAGQATSVGGYGGFHLDPSQAGGKGGTASSSVGEWGGGSYPGGFGAAGNPGTAGGGGYDFVFGGDGILPPILPQ